MSNHHFPKFPIDCSLFKWQFKDQTLDGTGCGFDLLLDPGANFTAGSWCFLWGSMAMDINGAYKSGY